MKVDKKRFKELKKEAGGIAKIQCSLIVNLKEGLGEKNNQSCNFYIYPNGLYFDFTFGDKIYISMDDIKNIKCTINIIEVYMSNEEVIKFEISKEKDIVKAYNLIVDYAKLMNSKLTVAELKEQKRKEFERIMASNPEVDKSSKPKEKPKSEYQELMDMYAKARSDAYTMKLEDNTARCPKCGSTSLSADKKGFSLAKGAAGVFLAGPYGAVAAGHGKNKVIVTCLNCGHQWKAGK